MQIRDAARFAAILVVFSGLVAAQTPNATLVGRVTDSTRAGIPGAIVKVVNAGTNATRTVQTQENGEYTVSSLDPGNYNVSISKDGFREVRESGLTLQVDQTARLDAVLQVGAVSESIEVQASTPVVNSENFYRGDVISSRELEEMPLNGRNFNDLAFLVAGVQPSEQSAKGSPYVANGARADASGVFIDGINDESPRDAGSQANPPLDSLQEFRFQTNGYSAEYGRLAGGVVTMVLRSGTNQFHGSLFEYVRNDFFDARNFFDVQKSELRRNQFGGTISGPLMIPKLYNGHDKTFYLVSWESYRQVQGSNSIGVVPTALERQGNFTQDLNATGQLIHIRDPLASGTCSATSTAGCFPGNIIPASRISAISQQLLQYYPVPNLSGPNNYIANHSTPDNWDNFLFKVDQHLSVNDNMAIRILQRWETSSNPFAGSPLGTFGATTNSSQELYGLSETHIFTPQLLNEFRFGLTRTVSNEVSAHAGTNYAAQLGITGTTTDPSLLGFPKFTVTGYETFGDNASDPIRYTVNDFDTNDTLTWNKGRHSIKFGGDILRVQYYQPTNSNFNGTFAFNGKVTNDGFGDLLLGDLSSTTRKIGTVTNHLYDYNLGFFVQDDYKILPSLTLNLGLRYEIQTAPYEKYGQMENYDPGLGLVLLGGVTTVPGYQATVATAGLTGLVDLASNHGIPKSLANTNYDNFAPRVGIAWRPFPDNKTVIRTGYGIFYTGSRLSAIRTDLAGGFPFSVSQTFTGNTTTPNVTLANPFPAALAKVSGVTTANGYEINSPSPYLQSWNFTVERDLGHGIALEVGYAGSKGTHLGRKYDLNQQVRTPTATTRPYPGFGDIEYYSFGSNSSYNSGTVTLKKRFDHGLFFRANYTYAKSIDDQSGLNYAGAGGFQGAQNSLNLNSERGLSDFDIRNSFSMNFAWRPSFSRNFLARDWQLAGSGTAYSGQPFTPYVSAATIDLGQATRPNRLANGSLPNPTVSDWFNLNAFAIVPDSAYAFGNSGRNILEGPGTLAINLSLSREFVIRERNRFQFRWEVFNFTNHTNFNLPNDALDKANAGTITGNKPARIMQLALRYQF
jgi:outer membrane receptor protein involved in Fe transport